MSKRNNSNTMFIFALSIKDKNSNTGWREVPTIVVFINTRKVWEKEECLTDHYTDKECKILEPILNKLSLEEASESTFDADLKVYPPNTKGLDQLKKDLIKEGLEYSKAFQEYMDEQ